MRKTIEQFCVEVDKFIFVIILHSCDNSILGIFTQQIKALVKLFDVSLIKKISIKLEDKKNFPEFSEQNFT